MNLLIVDADPTEADRTEDILNREKFHISAVYRATSMQEALTMLQETRISLVLCDTTFPGGSGQELTAWINSHCPRTFVIFITGCHDFEIARNAINLGVKGYLHKPADPVQLELSMQQVQLLSDSKNRGILRQIFWHKLLYEADSPIRPDFKKYGFSPGEVSRIFPFLITWIRKKEEAPVWKDSTIQFLIRNVAAEVLTEHLEKEDILVEGNRILILCTTGLLPQESLMRRCEYVLEKCSEYLNSCSLSGYVCGTAALSELPKALRRLYLFERQDICKQNRIVHINEIAQKKIRYEKPDIELWAEQLFTPNYKQVLEELNSYLNRIRRYGYGNQSLLICFQVDLLQEINRILSIKQVSANMALAGSRLKERFASSTNSVENMMSWLEELAACLEQYRKPAAEPFSIVEKVKEYICEHLEQDITRSELAALVYVHPDYLSHIFKAETGMSISDYISH